MKEESGGAVEGCRSGLSPGSIASSVDIAKWRPRELPNDPKRTWNTHRLGWRVGADFSSAACAGVLVAPFITIIDRYEPLFFHTARCSTDIKQRHHRECVRSKLFGIECPILSSCLTPQTSSISLLETIRPHLCPLHRHLPNSKLHRYCIIHSPQHFNYFYYSWYRQIRRNLLDQPHPLPLERHTFHPSL